MNKYLSSLQTLLLEQAPHCGKKKALPPFKAGKPAWEEQMERPQRQIGVRAFPLQFSPLSFDRRLSYHDGRLFATGSRKLRQKKYRCLQIPHPFCFFFPAPHPAGGQNPAFHAESSQNIIEIAPQLWYNESLIKQKTQ